MSDITTEGTVGSALAARRVWAERYGYYRAELLRMHRFLVPEGMRVLEVGCGDGSLLAGTRPYHGVGVERDSALVADLARAYPYLHFYHAEASDLGCLGDERFDYVILHGLLNYVSDIQSTLAAARDRLDSGGRIVLSIYGWHLGPILRLATRLGWRQPTPLGNWITETDLANFLELTGLESVRSRRHVLSPFRLAGLGYWLNRVAVHLPGVGLAALMKFYILRRKGDRRGGHTPSVSVVVPARNEAGNIEAAVARLPRFAKDLEVIFVEGGSGDGTWEAIQRVCARSHEGVRVRAIQQPGRGKGDAVRAGFATASGEVLMILDADLAVPPEELPKFYQALVDGVGDLINGSRLVYPVGKRAMRFANLVANRFFAAAFTWLLGQRLKDTLCGTKVLWRCDYEEIARNRHYFGNFDPFGDFDLLFGAAKLSRKIIELPVRYRERTYGKTNIQRWRHGLVLLRMLLFACTHLRFV